MDLDNRPFLEGHLGLAVFDARYKKQAYESAKWLKALGELSQAGTHSLDGRILYISAWFSVSPGVVEVFILPTIYARHFRKTFFKEIHWWLADKLQEPEVRRIQTWGEDTDQSRSWLSHLGFKQEGLLYSYGPDGEPVSIWGMVKCKQ